MKDIDLFVVRLTFKQMRDIWLCPDEFRFSSLCSTLDYMYRNEMISLRSLTHTKNYIHMVLPKRTIYKFFNPKSLHCWKPYSKYSRVRFIDKELKVLDLQYNLS